MMKFVRDVMIASGIPKEKITVMHAFAEPLMINLPPVPSFVRRGSDQSVLFAGRLESYKGVHVLIESLKYLPATTQIKVVGTGPDEARLKAIAAKDTRVEFCGFVPGKELWNMMGKAAVVVVPSIWNEPYGLVALEAMCQGTPIIVAKSGGLPEIVGESDAGIVVSASDPKALAKAISAIVDHPDRAKAMGKAALERAREIGDPQAHLAKIMEVYMGCG